MSEAVREAPKKERPEFRNIHVTELSNYRMPLAAIVSILHRISGVGMFVLLPSCCISCRIRCVPRFLSRITKVS